MGYRIGNAPVSCGAWNLEASRSPSVPPPDLRLLRAQPDRSSAWRANVFCELGAPQARNRAFLG